MGPNLNEAAPSKLLQKAYQSLKKSCWGGASRLDWNDEFRAFGQNGFGGEIEAV
jgi:hypothetical protein